MTTIFKSPLPIYTQDLDDDHIPTCPQCSSRTDILAEISETEQHHKCLKCEYEYILIFENDTYE